MGLSLKPFEIELGHKHCFFASFMLKLSCQKGGFIFVQ
jgi:hypothetical protein